MVWSLVLGSCIISLYTAGCVRGFPSLEQEVFSGNSNYAAESPVLRRFNLGHASKEDVAVLFDSIELADLDVWHVAEHHVDVFIPRSHDQLALQMEAPTVVYDDNYLPKSMYQHSPTASTFTKTWDLSSLSNSSLHTAYRRLSEIEQFIQDLETEYPDIVTVVKLGHSAEGRELYALEISKDKKSQIVDDLRSNHTEHAKKAGFLLTGAQHAREWIATSTAMYLTHALVANETEPFSLRHLLNSFNFYIILVPNPDGYEYTWDYDRLWYKNRQIIGPNEKCIGIDMNRNWGYKWKPVAQFPLWAIESTGKKKRPKVPTDPCSHWYPGHRPFEAPEVNSIANYVTTLPRLQAFVELRSYGQMISSPYSYNCKRIPKDAEDQIEAAMGAAKAIKEVHGTSFTTGRLCQMLYKAPGNVVDYMFAKASIKYAYAAHLRDTGTYGFTLPPEWIRPVGEETVSMIKSLARFMSGIKGE